MSEPEYMTGEEIGNAYYRVNRTGLSWNDITQSSQCYWNRLADILKVPRPPKLKTLFEVWEQWEEDADYYNEASIENLRVQLNAAREALDKAVT